MPEDDHFFLEMAFTLLGPFSAVLWFIAFSRLVLHRRAGYLMHLVIFFWTAAVIYLLLPKWGLPRLKITNAAFNGLFDLHHPPGVPPAGTRDFRYVFVTERTRPRNCNCYPLEE